MATPLGGTYDVVVTYLGVIAMHGYKAKIASNISVSKFGAYVLIR